MEHVGSENWFWTGWSQETKDLHRSASHTQISNPMSHNTAVLGTNVRLILLTEYRSVVSLDFFQCQILLQLKSLRNRKRRINIASQVYEVTFLSSAISFVFLL